MIRKINLHGDLQRIGTNKPVATPYSGAQPREYAEMWRSLNDNEKEYVRDRFFAKKGFHLGVWINPAWTGWNFPGNVILFYSEEALQALARVSGLSMDEMFNLLGNVKENTPYERQIIHLAFGDTLNTDEVELFKLMLEAM